ncbi:SDR family oxidoreductase [Streptomyces sp. NPDC056161]|uniref:SDR family oxidoreductase n=1 Tax=Streptomyces sp. NPDC056161 TaxID=3345732 RepID=UPI0035DEB417
MLVHGGGEPARYALAEPGAHLVLGARREDRLNAVVDRITARGGSAVGLVADVTRREDLKRLTDAALDRFGRLDVLVPNAGTMAVSPFDELRQDDWDAMVATHITGLLNGIGAALPIFRQQRSGQSVNVASTAAYVVKSPQVVYAATRTAVKVLTEGLRQESGTDFLRAAELDPAERVARKIMTSDGLPLLERIAAALILLCAQLARRLVRLAVHIETAR